MPADVTLTEADVRRIVHEETRFLTGMGFDVHQFEEGRPCILGGVHIPHPRGLAGHSDADVVVHAAMDACLGAAGLPDIGHFFPNTSEEFRGADSLQLAREVTRQLHSRKLEVVNMDIMVLAEEPKVGPHREAMRGNLAEVFGLPKERVALKATTMETMGFVGRGEGVAVMASALLRQLPG